MGLFADKYPDVPYEEKSRLWEQVKADPRFPTYLYGCYECGICVAACPSARFYDFSPRKIAQAAAREDINLIYEQMNDDVWNCSQCFSCNRCPRQNSPGGLITIIREVSVKKVSNRQALELRARIHKIMGTGTLRPICFSPMPSRLWSQVREVRWNGSVAAWFHGDSSHDSTGWQVTTRRSSVVFIWHTPA